MKKFLPFKIRPFNMANFSGGSGYLLPTFILYLMPATYLLNFIATSLLTFLPAKKAKSNGWVSVKTVKKCLYRKYLPFAAIIAIPLSIVSALTDAFDTIYTTGFIWVYLAAVFYAVIPFVLIFFSILTSVFVLCVCGKAVINDDTGEKMVKAKSVFGLSILFLFLFSIVAFIIMILLSNLIDGYDYDYY